MVWFWDPRPAETVRTFSDVALASFWGADANFVSATAALLVTIVLATLLGLAAGSAYCCLRRVLQAARIGHAVEGDTQATGEDCARCELTSERPSSVLRGAMKEAGEAPASAWYLIAFSDHAVPAEQMPGLTAAVSKQLRQASLQVKVLSPDAGADLETVRCL